MSRRGIHPGRMLVAALAAAGMAAAQDPPSRVGRLSYVSGAVSFQPSGVADWVAATVNRPLTVGDQLFADNGARAEVHMPGAAFRLGDRTAFEFMNLDDQNAQVRLSEGTLDVRVRYLQGNLEIDTPNVAFTVSSPGEYRLDANPDAIETLVTVRDGEGQVSQANGSFTLRMGQQAVIVGQDQAAQYKINPAPGYDSFDRWVMARNRRDDRYAYSPYVSRGIVGYEDLGEYGSWRTDPAYGPVWVPGGIPPGWAPYQDGHWAWVDPWGWTWVDDEPWGFAPFHYGRWAYLNGFWGWCPGPVAVAPVYSPALVAWVGFGAGFGVSVGFGAGPAVGWFPLGPRDVYIPAFAASPAFVSRINITNTRVINNVYVNNVYNNYVRTRQIPVGMYMNRAVPGAVVAVPSGALAAARPVRQVALRLPPNQVAAIRAAVPGPRVAPRVESVLGRAPGRSVPHPPPAVLSRGVVARSAPPPPAPSFHQRQGAWQREPGRPLGVSELHDMARTAPPARPPVRVVAQSRPAELPRYEPPRNESAPRYTPAPARPAPEYRRPVPVEPQRAPASRPSPPRSYEPPRRPGPVRQPQRPAYTPPAPRERVERPAPLERRPEHH